jgi:hypothetical protein
VDKILLRLKDEKMTYYPGEKIRGEIEWDLANEVKAIMINIFWYTVGRGDQDTETVIVDKIDMPLKSGRQDFAIELPMAPYSYKGQISSLNWAVEVSTLEAKVKDAISFKLNPFDQKIKLPEVKQERSKFQHFLQDVEDSTKMK